MEFYNALCPYYQNDKIEIRQAEPYSYCQFVVGKSHTAFGRARHPFMTGTGGWAYFAATQYMLGIKPGLKELFVNPCIPEEWDGFSVKRRFRNAVYDIRVENPLHISKGIQKIYVDGKETEKIPVCKPGTAHTVLVIMGRREEEK